MKVYTLCDKCNKEFEVGVSKSPEAYFVVMSTCPHCQTLNHRWIKIVVPEVNEKKEKCAMCGQEFEPGEPHQHICNPK